MWLLGEKSRKLKIWTLNHQNRASEDVVNEPGENNVLELREDIYKSEVTSRAERLFIKHIW